MKTRFVVSMFAVGAMLAMQGLVGCGTDSSGTKTGTGGAQASGGATSRGGATSNGGATSRGGATGNGGATGVGGNTVPRDAGRDLVSNRDTARSDATTNRDTARNDTATACGGEGEPCCAPNNSCDAGLTCQRQGGERICLPEDQPVDSGRNDTARTDTARTDTARVDTARVDTATDCGGQGEPCCAGRTCDDGLTCIRLDGADERTCEPEATVDAGGNRDTNIRRDTAVDTAEECGGLGEDCCAPDDTCDDGLTCRRGTCREAEVDSGAGGGP